LARLQGEIVLKATVNSEGNVIDVTAVGGHPMLRAAATQNLKEWKFSRAFPCACTVNREVRFLYKLSKKSELPNDPKAIMKWFENHVEIEAPGPPIDTQYSR
jgi:TonB-like protein